MVWGSFCLLKSRRDTIRPTYPSSETEIITRPGTDSPRSKTKTPLSSLVYLSPLPEANVPIVALGIGAPVVFSDTCTVIVRPLFVAAGGVTGALLPRLAPGIGLVLP